MLNHLRSIKICLGCHDPLFIGKNISNNKFLRSDYRCKHCSTLQAGGLCHSLPINKQFALGMKQHRVDLLKKIDSYKGKVGRPPKIVAELKLFIKKLNKAIKEHEKK
ncbi:hypothetical protein CBI30_06965 [Polynucleobacter aenigmaticus]|uniref:Uncharacterized protein n=1 Tax=Polynucleobacter aenigmaticus TaxID=1743164 RepID=A0A254PY56_9BURK|nr:hypothetical protein CBI30_06965 [Polynucleobacter aenigmaticus]